MTEAVAHYRPLKNRADVMDKMAPFVPDGVPVDAKTNFELHADVTEVNREEQWEHMDDSHPGSMHVENEKMYVSTGHNPFAYPGVEASWQDLQFFPETGERSRMYEFTKAGDVYNSKELEHGSEVVLVDELSPDQNRALFLNLFRGFTAHLEAAIAGIEPQIAEEQIPVNEGFVSPSLPLAPRPVKDQTQI